MSTYKNRGGPQLTRVSNGVAPSDYTGPTAVLTIAGISGALASGANTLSLGCIVAPAGAVLIAFGTSAADAIAKVQGGGTPASLLGMVVKIQAVGDVDEVEVPESTNFTHYAVAEAHAVPTGQLQITQG